MVEMATEYVCDTRGYSRDYMREITTEISEDKSLIVRFDSIVTGKREVIYIDLWNMINFVWKNKS